MASKVKLTEAQKGVLTDVAAGHILEEHFDVYGPRNSNGYTCQWHQGELVRLATVRKLFDLGYLTAGDTTRPYSGHRITPYTISPSGRAHLASSGKDD